MKCDKDPDNGLLFIGPEPADERETFILLPVVDEPGTYWTVFSDGSYTRWIPKSAKAA